MTVEPQYINDLDALVTAAYEGEYELVKRLVVNGADINVTNEYGETAVIVAAESGYDSIIELLLAHKANINIKDKDGDTALDIAKYNGHARTVTLLLSSGAVGIEGACVKERMMDEYYDACDQANVVKKLNKIINDKKS